MTAPLLFSLHDNNNDCTQAQQRWGWETAFILWLVVSEKLL